MPSELPIYYDYISVCLYKRSLDEGSVKSYFEDIQKVELPEGFLNRTVDIQPDSIAESEILFGESGSEVPEDADNSVVVNSDEEEGEELHIHFYFDQDTISEGIEIFDNIMEVLGSAEVNIFTIESVIAREFGDFDLPIQSNSDYNPDGVRFTMDGVNYLVQTMPEEAIPEDADGGVYLRFNQEMSKEVESGESFIEEHLEEVERKVSHLLEQ